MKRIQSIFIIIFFALSASYASVSERPNVIVILADDLGYGDVGAYNPDSKISTPAMDRLAREGMCFTDAHSSIRRLHANSI